MCFYYYYPCIFIFVSVQGNDTQYFAAFVVSFDRMGTICKDKTFFLIIHIYVLKNLFLIFDFDANDYNTAICGQ